MTPDDAKELLLHNYGDMKSLKASGEISLEISEAERKPASFVLMLERPAKLRLRAYRPLVPFLFELVSDGDVCWLYVPSERKAYLNNDCGTFHGVDKDIAASAQTIVAALVVVAEPNEFLETPAEIERKEGLIQLKLGEEGGAHREIWLDSQTGLVLRQLFMDVEGVVQADISYKKQTTQGQTVIPVEIDVAVPKRHVSMQLRLNDLKVNPEIPAQAFEFSPPENVRILDLNDTSQQ
ncbi:MAG: hypothetical protein HY801_06285 [Candidatus Lindowbacteria bacterium]|nr:hypothetical protein [Candidatus Lindowbacteria bacterium]